MTQISCRGILFDLDGVLIDSTPAVARVWTWWAQEHGFNPAQVVHEAHGRPSISTIRQFLPNADHERENERVEQAEINDVAGIVALPGASDLLRSIPENRWAIVTSGTRKLAEVRLTAAGLRVPERMVTASDIVNGKPHPEPYLKGAALLDTTAADCLVVEDVSAGVTAAKAAKATVVGLLTTVAEDELRRAGADWIIPDCRAITVISTKDLLQVTLAGSR